MRRLTALAVAVAVLTGCGSDDGSSGAPSTEVTTSTTVDGMPPDDAATDEEEVPEHPLVVAHRGASGLAPENTVAAVERAVELGADVIEVDVQLTADGEVVVLHDTDLDRTARGPVEDCTGPIDTRTLTQVQGCDAGTWFSEANPDLADPSFAEQHVPSLAEVLAAGGDEVRWLIETKTQLDDEDVLEEAVAEVLDAAGFTVGAPATERIVVQSFDPGSVRRMNDLRPDLALWTLLPVAVDGAALDEVARVASGIGIARDAVDADLLAAAHERCLTVVPYTVDDPDEMARLLDLGVDGLISNRPDLLLPLATASDWSPPCDAASEDG